MKKLISRHKGYHHYATYFSGKLGDPLPFEGWLIDKQSAMVAAKDMADCLGVKVVVYWCELLDGELSKVGAVMPSRACNP